MLNTSQTYPKLTLNQLKENKRQKDFSLSATANATHKCGGLKLFFMEEDDIVEGEEVDEAEISLHAMIDVTTQFWVLPKLSFSLWNIKKLKKKEDWQLEKNRLKKISNAWKTGVLDKIRNSIVSYYTQD